jgi:hypothetical protein
MEPLQWYRIVTPFVVCALLAMAARFGHARFRFAGMGVIAGVCYGVLQDQVSARLCPEYFTVFHQPIPGITDPTLLGVTWGFLATWWAGLFLGYIAGLIATIGTKPKLLPYEVIRPLLLLLAFVAMAVAITGVTVWWHAELMGVSIDPGLGMLLPPERHRALLVVSCYHFVAYVVSFVGSLVLWVWIWRERLERGKMALAINSKEMESSPEKSSFN